MSVRGRGGVKVSLAGGSGRTAGVRGRTVNVAVDVCDAAGSVLRNESIPDDGLTDVLHVHAHVGLHVLGDVQLRSRVIGEGAGRERDADDGVTKRQPRAHYVVARTP